jgi:aminopeptidase-like protein
MLYLLPCGSQHLENSLSISVMTSKRQTHSLIDFSDVKSLGATFQEKLNELFALNRSLTGRSNRLTLDSISQWTELQMIETPSGTKAFDWQVPQEWQLNAAYIEDAEGNRLIDIANNPLHVVSYSIECDITLSFSELEDHLHTHPNLDQAIPYRTSYYKPAWGFCVTHSQLSLLRKAAQPLHAVIESTFHDGYMTSAEAIHEGASKREVLISSYICHPAMANDSLSGVLLAAMLSRYVSELANRRSTYRFVFVPETIGAISYLASNAEQAKNIDFGLQITTVGGPGEFQIKSSFENSHAINRIISGVLEQSSKPFSTLPFDIHGSDERQYSSPGFRINMATLAKDIYYSYPQYHTSLDNLDFVNGEQIAETFILYTKIIDEIEKRRVFVRTEPHGEPMLSRHDLYNLFGGALLPGSDISELDLVLGLLFHTDGQLSTSDIAVVMNQNENLVLETSLMLTSKNLLLEI